MIDKCPICGNSIEGYGIDKRESSFLRSTYKFLGSIASPIPFVGSYIYGKLYNSISGNSDQYHRFVCMNCRCSWVSTSNSPETKIGGDKLCSLYFIENSYVIGSVEHDCYMTIRNFGAPNEVAYIYKSKKCTIYENGICRESSRSFTKKRIENGFFIGEIENGMPNGYGVIFHKNGNIWYGGWKNGMKNGVGFGCSYEGKNSIQGYWENNVQTLNL